MVGWCSMGTWLMTHVWKKSSRPIWMVAMRACARSRSECALPLAGAPPPMPCRADRGDGLVSYMYMDMDEYIYIYIYTIYIIYIYIYVYIICICVYIYYTILYNIIQVCVFCKIRSEWVQTTILNWWHWSVCLQEIEKGYQSYFAGEYCGKRKIKQYLDMICRVGC